MSSMIEIGERKVWENGPQNNKTYPNMAVVLPKIWAKNVDIEPGDKVKMSMTPTGQLIIQKEEGE